MKKNIFDKIQTGCRARLIAVGIIAFLAAGFVVEEILPTNARAQSQAVARGTESSKPTAMISGSASSGCVANVKTDRSVYPEPPLPALPAAGGKFCDPTFGTEIMRVTDANDGNQNGTEYAYYPTFNSNNTKLLVFSSDGSLFWISTR